MLSVMHWELGRLIMVDSRHFQFRLMRIAGVTKLRKMAGAKLRTEPRMSKVRVLVETRKGAFVLTSDGKREQWDISGPLFAGWEIYHLKGSPADPNRLYVSQSSGWFGQQIQRSNDGGQTWEPVGNKFVYDGVPGTHHRSRPGVLFMQQHWDVMRSDDAGESWQEISGNLPSDFGFTIDLHEHEPETIYVVPSRATRSTILPAVWARGRGLQGELDETGLRRVLYADTWWGITALFWIATGLMRAFGGLEKGASTTFTITCSGPRWPCWA